MQDPVGRPLHEAAEELGLSRLVAVKAYERLSVRILVMIEDGTVTLTPSGNETRSQISAVYRMVGDDISGRLSTDTIDVLEGVLAQAKRNMQRALGRNGRRQ